MRRWLLVVALYAVLMRGVMAGERPRTTRPAPVYPPVAGPPPNASDLDPLTRASVPTTSRVAPAEAAAPVPSGRKQIEALLKSPARLDFGDRNQVTLKDVLDQLYAQHHLSIRFDTPTIASMLGAQPPVQPGGAYANPATAVLERMIVFPGTLQCVSEPPPHVLAAQPAGAIGPVPVAGPNSGTPSPYAAELPQALPVPPPSAPVQPSPAPQPPSSQPAAAPRSYEPPAVAEPPSSPDAAKQAARRGVSFDVESQTSPPASAGAPSARNALAEALDVEIDLSHMDLSRVTVATLLRHALDAMPTGDLAEMGLPILFTQAGLLDYLIEDDSLLITTRMKALTTKETRVYSVRNLNGVDPQEIAKTIRQSIRPWSWRSQINDLGEQLKGTPLPAETLTSMIKSGVQLAGAEVGVTVTPSPEEVVPQAPDVSKAEQARQMEMLGNAVVNGLVTLTQATLSALEMVHYAEPPTGTIQTLGSRLIITQSQTAHREIAELLRQLAEE